MLELYLALWLITLPLMALLAWRTGDWLLLKCVLVVALDQAILTCWHAVFAPPVFTGQPWAVHAVSYLACGTLASRLPASRLCATLAGVYLAAFLWSVGFGISDWTKTTDLLYWQSNVAISVATYLLLITRVGVDGGKSIYRIIVRRRSRLAYPQN